jgi:hypothetical protein
MSRHIGYSFNVLNNKAIESRGKPFCFLTELALLPTEKLLV